MRKFNFIKLLSSVLILSALCIATLLTACKDTKSEKTVLALDTVITMTAEGENSKETLEKAADFLKELDKKSNFDENSELTLLNKDTSADFINLSPEIYEMIALGKFYTGFTKGTYDISAGPLTKLWDSARETQTPPAAKEVSTAKSKVNAENIILAEGKVKKSKADAEVTFGGIAKGYAIDKVISLYKVNNVSGFLNFGTSAIAAIGDKTYRIGVKNPRDEGKMLGVVELNNAVLSTSGDYERCFIKDGVRYHHIIDPSTGYPADSGIASATVIVPLTEENAGAMSDALSTALMVAGEKGKEFLPEGAKALLVTTEGDFIKLNGFELLKF